MLKWLIITLTSISSLVFSQTEFHYLVQFKFKSNGDLSHPEEFLSEKAILKKDQFNILLDSTDLPINTDYLDSLNRFQLTIETKSKWHNCVVTSSNNSEVRDSITNLSIVDTVYLIGERNLSKTTVDKFNYDESAEYIQSLNLVDAHNKNYTGKGVDIAVIDAGFKNVNYADPYDHLFNEGRVKGTFNFVNNSAISYSAHSHGSNVVSFIGAKTDSFYVGTAPDANFYFLITEDINQENQIEEFHLIEALEYCDSAGVDVVNISLGYYDFDDNRFSRNQSDFSGNTTLLNKACNLGWTKGLFIVASSGNSGNTEWGVTTTPGNADSVLTVGSVNIDLNKSGFSSTGNPHYLNSQKPNVVAVGEAVNSLNSSGNVSPTGGTSFSAPQIAGLVACLKEAFPQKNNWQLKQAIEKSAHQHNSPDSLIGFGIPNFQKAFLFLHDQEEELKRDVIIPNPNNGNFIYSNSYGETYIEIIDSRGQIVFELSTQEELVTISNLNLSQGVYYLINHASEGKAVTKFVVF